MIQGCVRASLVGLVVLATSATAFAEPILPRETADVLPAGRVAFGLFNPLRVGLPHVELELHPLLALVAPHVDARFWLAKALRPGALRVSGVVGVAVPTGAFRLGKPFGIAGDLVPSCLVAKHDASQSGWCERPGWMVVPKLGLAVSKGVFVRDNAERGVFTLRGGFAKGFAASGKEVRPLDAWAPITVQLAPFLGKWRAELRAAYDHAVLDGLRLRGELGVTWLGRPEDDPLSPLFLNAYLGVDVQTSEHTRVTLGAMVWNADKHRRVVETGPDGFATASYPRSFEVWPTVDLLWRY